MSAAKRAPETPPEEDLTDEVVELLDVPAAIVCAVCGKPECAGCALDDVGNQTQSGVVVFVPWERPIGGVLTRLWSTARASTDGAESFFSAMPEGAIGPALTFAVVAEAVAVGSSLAVFAAILAGLAWLVLPALASALLADARWQAHLGRMFFAAWLAFTAMLVGAHAIHGYTLDRAARRERAKSDVTRALRFGLYAAGWDVATSPFGLVAALCGSGLRGLAGARVHAFRTPGRATAAMLRGIYGLSGEPAARARRRSMAVAGPVSVVAVIAALVVVALAALRVGFGIRLGIGFGRGHTPSARFVRPAPLRRRARRSRRPRASHLRIRTSPARLRRP